MRQDPSLYHRNKTIGRWVKPPNKIIILTSNDKNKTSKNEQSGKMPSTTNKKTMTGRDTNKATRIPFIKIKYVQLVRQTSPMRQINNRTIPRRSLPNTSHPLSTTAQTPIHYTSDPA